MKNVKSFLFVAVVAMAFSLPAAKISGYWFLTRMVNEGQARDLSILVNFREDGVLVQRGIEVAQWTYQPDQEQITLKSELDKDFNGIARIQQVNDQQLVFEKDGIVYYMDRIHRDKWLKDNQKAVVVGVWQSKNKDQEVQYLRFDLPDQFALVGLFDGGESESHGTWMYRPEENAVYIFSMTHFCDGKNKILNQSQDAWVFENNGQQYKATRVDVTNFDTLAFDGEGIPEGDPTRLPAEWQNREDWFQKLDRINQLTYRKGRLLQAVGVVSYRPLIFKIRTNPDEDYLSYRFLTVSGGDTSQYREEVLDQFDNNPFFPYEAPPMYRVVGEETITVPAGTFACTVVEAYDDFEEAKRKYWMITDQPGIYARIIESKQQFEDSREFRIWELEKIRYSTEK